MFKSFIPAGMIQGANISFKRVALQSVNGFDDRFGAGTRFPCEDIDVCARASAAGWHGAYDPRPIIYHHHGRKTEAEATRLMKLYDHGRGAYYAKGLLNPAICFVTFKKWLLFIISQPYSRTAREVLAAMEYWTQLTISTAKRRWGIGSNGTENTVNGTGRS
jgi:GT2 family glycosyltransferase